ncbi:MAG TPA: hypothetical protein VNS81_11405 [Nocardioides sp.]|nr:hypothetical protein [Nocardioides sp.]
MSAHRVPRRSLWAVLKSVRVRLLLSLGLVLTPAVMGTYASWSDSGTISGMEIRTGTLDLALGASAGDQLVGLGGTWSHTSLSLSAMLPGESVAQPITFRNAGTTPLTLTSTASASSNALNPSLRLTIVAGATVGNTGSESGGNRAGTCTGGSATWLSSVSVSTTSTAAFPTTPVSLQPGDTVTTCARLALDSTAANALQNQTVTVTIVATAAQP